MCLFTEITSRQLSVVPLVAEGLKNKEIGSRLGTTELVIKNYVKDILERTGCFNRTELAMRFVHHQWKCDCLSQLP